MTAGGTAASGADASVVAVTAAVGGGGATMTAATVVAAAAVTEGGTSGTRDGHSILSAKPESATPTAPIAIIPQALFFGEGGAGKLGAFAAAATSFGATGAT